MAGTSAVYARINSDLKQEAETILAQLGISPSSAIQMLYSQVVLNNGLPFTPRIPGKQPLDLTTLTREQLNAEIQRGMDSLSDGKGIPADEVDSILAREYGL